MAVREEDLINVIAKWERSIIGVEHSYDFAKNENNINTGKAPCVLHYPPVFKSKPQAHHNRWNNSITVRSSLLVAPRASRGANLSYLENEAMPFLQKWRLKFQQADVINDMLGASPSVTRAFLASGSYGVGGELLTINNTPWIGCIFNFEFTEII